MTKKLTDRLIGAEIEYIGDNGDIPFDYVNEYYRGMREINTILLPGTNVLESLLVIKDIMIELDKKMVKKLGTFSWLNSYGIAYNGAHLHLSGSIDSSALERNILRLIAKHGFSPRTVTSWHIFNRPTKYNFKNKRKHTPIYQTPRDTTEIRILDIEYLQSEEILVDLATAIEFAYNGKDTEGDFTWANKLKNIHLEDYQACCAFLDNNLAAWWTKVEEGVYKNNNGGDVCNFKDLDDWAPQEPVLMVEDDLDEVITSIRSSQPTRGASDTLSNAQLEEAYRAMRMSSPFREFSADSSEGSAAATTEVRVGGRTHV